MAVEHIMVEVKEQSFHAIVDEQETGWQAACRFPDVDFLVSHASDRETAINGLVYIMANPALQLANRLDEVTAEIGVRWAIRPRVQ